MVILNSIAKIKLIRIIYNMIISGFFIRVRVINIASNVVVISLRIMLYMWELDPL